MKFLDSENFGRVEIQNLSSDDPVQAYLIFRMVQFPLDTLATALRDLKRVENVCRLCNPCVNSEHCAKFVLKLCICQP
jgi:hypothetical protein